MNRYKHTRRGFLKTIGIGAAAAVAPGLLSAAAPKRKPNVILVMTDDQGYGDLACHGNNVIKTPGLDELYKQSVRLKDFHVDPCCSPTRAALLTGRYSSRSGVWHTVMGRSLLRKTEVTMADVFASGGYRTGMFGKWHLGDNYPFRPQDRGFQETLCHGGGAIGKGGTPTEVRKAESSPASTSATGMPSLRSKKRNDGTTAVGTGASCVHARKPRPARSTTTRVPSTPDSFPARVTAAPPHSHAAGSRSGRPLRRESPPRSRRASER